MLSLFVTKPVWRGLVNRNQMIFNVFGGGQRAGFCDRAGLVLTRPEQIFVSLFVSLQSASHERED